MLKLLYWKTTVFPHLRSRHQCSQGPQTWYPLRVRKGGPGVLLWRSAPFFGVCDPFLSQWAPTMCMLPFLNPFLFLTHDGVGITAMQKWCEQPSHAVWDASGLELNVAQAAGQSLVRRPCHLSKRLVWWEDGAPCLDPHSWSAFTPVRGVCLCQHLQLVPACTCMPLGTKPSICARASVRGSQARCLEGFCARQDLVTNTGLTTSTLGLWIHHENILPHACFWTCPVDSSFGRTSLFS